MNFKAWLRRSFATTPLLFATGIPLLAADRTMTRKEYAVYSAVLANIRLSHLDQGEALAIVRDTIAPTQDCSSLPSEFRRRAFSSAHGKMLKDKKLVIGRRYILLTPQQAD